MRALSSHGKARGFLVAVLLGGPSCDDASELVTDDSSENELGILLEGLGADVTSCTAAAVTAGALSLSLGTGQDAVVSVVSNRLRINGHQCKLATTGALLTASTVTKLEIRGSLNGTSHKVVLDLLPGGFGGLFGSAGGITLDVNGASDFSVGVRGTDAANNFKMAQDAAGTSLFIELNGNTAADVKVIGVPSSVIFALGAGNDTFNAQDTTSLTFLGAAASLRAVQGTLPVTVYGGIGSDTLEGGLGNDVIDGGDGTDTFLTIAAGTDGADIYRGGAGLDTIDYNSRDAGVLVDIDPGHTRAFIHGVSLHGKSLSAGLALTLDINGAPFSYSPGGAVSGITSILQGINGVAGFSLAATASVDDRGKLVIVAANASEDIVVTANTQSLFVGTPSGLFANLSDNDDGAPGEQDDVKSDVENIKGSAWGDVLTGSAEPNVIDGLGGNDDLSGGPAGACSGTPADSDTLNGGDGDDVFRMGALANCRDTVDGGAGVDMVSYEMRTTPLTITLDSSANDGAGELDNVKTTVEVVLGGEGADTITGGAAHDELHGGMGNDIIKGGAGDDTLIGGPGDDRLTGEAGNDTFDEASAADTAFVNAATMSAFGGKDIIHGGVGINVCDFRRAGDIASTYTLCFSAVVANCAGPANDGDQTALNAGELDDLTNCNQVLLGGGIDNVTGSAADDIIDGGGGNDVIDGGDGNDSISGGDGDDTLSGGAGGDSLYAGAGAGTQVGGDGASDMCVPKVDPTCEL